MKATLIVLLLVLPIKGFAPNITKLVKHDRHVVEVKKNLKEENKELVRFLKKLAHYESRNTIDTVNSIGAMGLYQLMPIALKDINYTGTVDEFLKDSVLQTKCVIKVMKKNKRYLKHYCKNYKQYIGKEIHGVKITYSGILAAVHLGGINNIKKFFNEGYNAKDCNMSIKDYMRIFGGFNLEKII